MLQAYTSAGYGLPIVLYSVLAFAHTLSLLQAYVASSQAVYGFNGIIFINGRGLRVFDGFHGNLFEDHCIPFTY